VYVTPQDYTLHLSISEQPSEPGAWQCGEVSLAESLGYGNYSWTVSSSLQSFHESVVLGLFIYEDDAHEIDAEFSRWGNSSWAATNADFAVQPSSRSNGNALFYTVPSSATPLEVSFLWSPGSVLFEAHELGRGGWHQSWSRTGPAVPQPGSELVHMNLWLFRGQAPAGAAGAQVAISSFSFVKL
jgi:hypothetical protein